MEVVEPDVEVTDVSVIRLWPMLSLITLEQEAKEDEEDEDDDDSGGDSEGDSGREGEEAEGDRAGEAVDCPKAVTTVMLEEPELDE